MSIVNRISSYFRVQDARSNPVAPQPHHSSKVPQARSAENTRPVVELFPQVKGSIECMSAEQVRQALGVLAL